MIQKLLFCFFLLITCSANSQINGLVTSEKDEPLPYVNIYLKNNARGTTTNGDGIYQLDIPAPGTYTLVFQFLGYHLAIGMRTQVGKMIELYHNSIPSTPSSATPS